MRLRYSIRDVLWLTLMVAITGDEHDIVNCT
jgi:hypothetical protein